MRLGTGKLRGQVEMVGTGVLAVFSRLPLSWRGVGVIIVGVLLARWTWILFAPHTLAVLPAKSDSGGNATEVLFGVASTSTGLESTGDAELGDVHLVGVFTGSQGFAVFKLDEKTQRGVALGEEIIKGTKLTEVGADYAVIDHNGLSQRLKLENKSNNKDSLVMDHPKAVSGVSQAVEGWNQANQEMQKMHKLPNAHPK